MAKITATARPLAPLLVGALALLPGTALAESRTSAPSGCISVPEDYSSIQSAVDSLSTSEDGTQCIFLAAGQYEEQVLVPSRKAQLSIYGATSDTSSYTGNQASIVSSLSQDDGLNNDQTGTLRVKADGFRLYNVDIINGYGEGSQAIALSAYADSGYYGVSLRGFQDTLLANEGSQVYAASEIVGATDFIFGKSSPAWFYDVDIRVLEHSVGYVTASGRDSDSGSNYYVFDGCDIAAADGEKVKDGAYYLGRPWRDHSRVVFQNTHMSSVINSAGWRYWNKGDERTDHVFYGEYQNSGDGAKGDRPDYVTQLSSPIRIEEVLGRDYASEPYFDSSYL